MRKNKQEMKKIRGMLSKLNNNINKRVLERERIISDMPRIEALLKVSHLQTTETLYSNFVDISEDPKKIKMNIEKANNTISKYSLDLAIHTFKILSKPQKKEFFRRVKKHG